MSVFSANLAKALVSTVFGVGVALTVASLVPTSSNQENRNLTSTVLTSSNPTVDSYEDDGETQPEELPKTQSTVTPSKVETQNSVKDPKAAQPVSTEASDDEEGEDMKPQPPLAGYKEQSTGRSGGYNWWPFGITSSESRIWTWGR